MCTLDTYVDTPGREQAQWWGDARVQAWNTFHLDGDPRILRKGIRHTAAQTTPDGVTYGHTPTIAHHCILPDFTLIWLLTLWDYYWQTGDLQPFREHRATISRALDYFRKWTCPETGLLRYDERHWLFLDWADLSKNGRPTLYSLWLLHALDRLRELHEAAGEPDDALACADWADKLRRHLADLFNEQGLLRDGYGPDGDRLSSSSVHTQTLASITELAPHHDQAMIRDRILPSVSGGSPEVVQPSAYWISYVYSLLGERGHGAAVVADIRRRWQPMVEHGSTWETFDSPRGEFSFSHAWSAHPLFHLMQILGGVRQSGVAWTLVHFQPTFIGDAADVTFPTPHGPIRSIWRRQAEHLAGRLELPPGVTATIDLPGQPTHSTAESFDYKIPATD